MLSVGTTASIEDVSIIEIYPAASTDESEKMDDPRLSCGCEMSSEMTEMITVGVEVRLSGVACKLTVVGIEVIWPIDSVRLT